jgi:membrane protein YdbS with pleckstrin-like domain
VPGEQLVVDVKPHWWVMVMPVGLTCAVIAGAVASLVVGAPRSAKWIVLVVLVGSLGWLAIRYARWSSTRLVVTDRRVAERRGLLRREIREIPVAALSDLGYRQGIVERALGIGDLVLESSGGGREVFEDLPHPEAIHNEIYRQLESWGRAPGSRALSVPEQIDQLDRLRQRGVISDAEFQAKKAQLLDRL